MRRFAWWALGGIAAIAVLVVAAVIALPSLVDTPRIQSYIAASASHALGRPVHFRSLSAHVFPLPAVELRGLEVADDPRFGPAPFLRLDRGDLRLKLGPLLGGRVEFGDLVLERPLVTVLQDASGRWNFASLGAPSADTRPSPPRPRGGGGAGGAPGAAAVLASSVRLRDGLVTYTSRAGGRAGAGYRLEKADVTVTPAPGALSIEGSARVMPGAVDVNLKDVTIALTGGRPLTEAALRGRVTIDGKDVKDLVATALGPEPSLGGGVHGALALGGVVGSPKAAGDVELPALSVTRTNPACAAPKQRTLKIDRARLNVTFENGELVARPVSAELAGGSLTANAIATLEGGHVDLRDVGVKGLMLDKVLVDFLCQAYAVSGPLALTGNFAAALRDPWSTLSGAGELRIGPGKVIGAQAIRVLGGVARLAGAASGLLGTDPAALGGSPIDFDSITGTFRVSSGVVTTRDLLYTSRAMKVGLAGQYALASGRMSFDVTLDHPRGQLQAKVTGSAASPSIQLSPSSVVRSLDQGAIEGGLRSLLKRFR